MDVSSHPWLEGLVDAMVPENQNILICWPIFWRGLHQKKRIYLKNDRNQNFKTVICKPLKRQSYVILPRSETTPVNNHIIPKGRDSIFHKPLWNGKWMWHWGLPQYAGFLKCSTPKLSSKLFVTLNRCGETNGGKDWKGVSSNTVEYMAALRNDHGEFHISISEFTGGTPSWDGSPLISDGSSPVSKKHSGKTKDSSKSQENT